MINTKSGISLQTVHGKQIEKYLRAIAQLRIEVFREYPYLYDGSIEYEENYLKTYINSGRSIGVLAFYNQDLVGVSTGLPLNDETPEFRAPFSAAGLETDHIFYCGESIIHKNYRGRGIYPHFIRLREQYALSLQIFSMICFCAVTRPENHPLKPIDYSPLDSVWQKFGYQKQQGLTTAYRWKDIDNEYETDKKMIFWTKKLAPDTIIPE